MSKIIEGSVDSAKDNSVQQGTKPKILQIANGRIIPRHSSAYSLRCHTLIKNIDRKIISVAGAVFKDEKLDYSEQYRSIILTGLSYLRGNKTLEVYISRNKFLSTYSILWAS